MNVIIHLVLICIMTLEVWLSCRKFGEGEDDRLLPMHMGLL